MNNQDIIKNLIKKNVLRLEKEINQKVMNEKSIKEVDTHFAGKILLLEIENKLIAKEEDGKGSIYFRMIDSKEDFEAFAKERLDAYDRMWDGCGCKVLYNEIWQKK